MIALAFAAPWTRAAHADDPSDRGRAREAYDAGLTALKHGQLDLALDQFRVAQSVLPHEKTAIAIATVEERLGQPEAALKTLKTFFTDPAKRSDAVRAQIRRLERAVPAKLWLSSESPGWSIWIDGIEEAGRTPTRVEVTPGKHKIELISPRGMRTEQVRTFAANTTYRIHGKAEPVQPDDSGTNVTGWVLASATVAALGTGIGFGLAALDAQSSYEASPSQAAYDDTQRYSLISDIAFAGAAVFAIGTLTAVLLDSDEERPTGEKGVMRIEPVASQHIVGLRAGGTF